MPSLDEILRAVNAVEDKIHEMGCAVTDLENTDSPFMCFEDLYADSLEKGAKIGVTYGPDGFERSFSQSLDSLVNEEIKDCTSITGEINDPDTLRALYTQLQAAATKIKVHLDN